MTHISNSFKQKSDAEKKCNWWRTSSVRTKNIQERSETHERNTAFTNNHSYELRETKNAFFTLYSYKLNVKNK